MRINPQYLPIVEDEFEPCFTVVRVSPRNWQVVDAADGYLICSCPSKILANMVVESLNETFVWNE